MKRTLLFVFALFALGLGLWTLLGSGSTPSVSAQANPTPQAIATPSPDLVAIHRKLFDDTNKGDIAAIMTAYTDDAVLISPTCPETNPCVGKAAIQKIYESSINIHNKVDPVVYYAGATNNVIKAIVESRADSYKAWGVERIIVNATITFTGNKISRYEQVWDSSDPQSVTLLKVVRGDLETRYRKFIADQNQGDVASVMTTWTDDAVLINPNCPEATPCVGKAAIQKIIEGQVANHVAVDIVALRVTTTTNTFQVTTLVRSDTSKAVGVDRILLNGTVMFSGTKISRIALTPDLSDPQSAAFVTASRPDNVYRRSAAALNKGDAAGFVANFTDDAVSIGSPGCTTDNPCVGKAAIQTSVESAIKTHQQVDILTMAVTANTVQLINDVRNDALKPLGLERTIANGTLTFTGGKISRMVFAREASDPQTAAYAKAVQAQATPVPK